METFIGLVQQGMILGQKCIVVGSDQATVQAEVDRRSKELNDQIKTETEGWTGVVLPVEGV